MISLLLPTVAIAASDAVRPSVSSTRSAGETGKTWVLRRLEGRLIERSDFEAATIVLGADHSLGGTEACNTIIGNAITWFADRTGKKGVFKHNRKESMISTLIGCPGSAAVDLGGRFWVQMGSARSWSVTAETLTITFADGSSASLMSKAAQ